MDMFASYVERGERFAAAVHRLRAPAGDPVRDDPGPGV
jgi:hypothetical protein